MDLYDQQRDKEQRMVSRGVERYMAQLETATTSGRHYDLAPYSTVLNEMVAVLVPHVEQMMDNIRLSIKANLSGSKGRRQSTALHMLMLDPVSTAYIVVRTILQESGCTSHTLAARIAGVLQMQVQLDLMKSESTANGTRYRIEALKRTVKAINPKVVKKWVKLLDDLTVVEWSWEDRVKVGLHMTHLVGAHLQDYVQIETVRRMANSRTSYRTEVHFTNELTKRLREQEITLANESPWLVPMICPPAQFTQTEDGGYLDLRHNMIKDNYYGVRRDQSYVPPQAVCDAVNNLSAVGWRVNMFVYDLAVTAIREERGEILPVSPRLPLPEPIDAEVWQAMDKAQRGKHKTDRRMVHDHNNKLESKRESMRRSMQVAEEHKQYSALYFPHTLDFRGRAYPLPQDLNPQGDDFVRGLLEFSEAKLIDARGHAWLCHAAAAAYGNDKMSLSEQVAWVRDSKERITRMVRWPFGSEYELWTAAEDPWQFIAACLELVLYWRAIRENQLYYSRLPVHVDGTCNGLQHLSAMGRDPVGAKAVNLSDGPRQDIYQDVADKVKSQIAQDCGILSREANIPARSWVGRVTRKVVKRGVMTTPYGVTPEGIRRQLIDDGLLDGVPGDKLASATYMRDVMGQAIDNTVIKGKIIMAWMQNVARLLSDENKPVVWTTPIGLVCKQEYRKPTRREFYTLVGRAAVVVPNDKGELRKVKQVNSIAPNIVHSFDAAHLMMTVNRAAELGLCVGTVHDSYGTHACDVDTLGTILREKFIEIYSEDQLGNLMRSFVQSGGREEEWMHPPPAGDYDINEVRNSTYFFF